jgi:hypothetical protein
MWATRSVDRTESADAARALLGCGAFSRRQHLEGATLTSTWFSIETEHKQSVTGKL